ncbi:hypothetical protein A0H76_512 [Hepatospora eriocheir]|uniref:Uncharacterized protein n=1 Tax=Hepatospora eriocheir TaxID=1081669 RepID=A0A1X0QL53_9MICR|nr:hypothetical protein A0H76_512 [Hepatospora eriocheir]
MEEEINKFKDIDIVDYLNKTHKTSDKFLVETQIHNLKKYQKKLNEDLYSAFITNSDALINILDTYQYSYNILLGLNASKNINHESNEVNIHIDKCKELSRKFRYFNNDMDPFVTDERYLVMAGFYNEDKIYLVISNDLTFIGIKTEKKYELKNSFSNKLVSVTMKGKDLQLKIQKIEYLIKGSKESLQDIIDIYDEVNYAYHNEENRQKSAIDKDLVKFYIISEQFNLLKDYLKDFNKIELNLTNIPVYSFSQLKTLMKISKNDKSIFRKFIIYKFNKGLSKIDKVQEVRSLIDEMFEYLFLYVESLEKLYNKLCLSLETLPLDIELLIKEVLNSLSKRIYNKSFQIDNTNEYLDLVESKLVFNGYNYKYLFKEFTDQNKNFNEKCIKEAEDQMNEILKKYFC